MPVAVVLVNRVLNDRTPLLQAVSISIRKTKIEYRRTVSALKFLMLRKGVTENGNRSSCWDSKMLSFDERDGHNSVSLHQIGGARTHQNAVAGISQAHGRTRMGQAGGTLYGWRVALGCPKPGRAIPTRVEVRQRQI
jgi:hypothetical protein